MLCLFIPWMTKDVFAFRFVRDANEVTNTFTKFVHDASFFLVRLSVELTVAALVLVAVFHRFFLCLFTYVFVTSPIFSPILFCVYLLMFSPIFFCVSLLMFCDAFFLLCFPLFYCIFSEHRLLLTYFL